MRLSYFNTSFVGSFCAVSESFSFLLMTNDNLKTLAAGRTSGPAVSIREVGVSQLDTQDIPAARARHSACLAGNYLYVYGGRCGHRVSREFWRFNLYNSVWEPIPSEGERPGLLEEHFMVSYGGAIFVFGYGVDQNNRSEIQVWRRRAEDLWWTRLHGLDSSQTVPSARQSASATVIGHKLYVFGGFVQLYQNAVNELLEYDLELDSWKLIARPEPTEGPSSLYGHTSVSFEGCIYVFGGVAHQRAQNALWKFCLSNKFWIICSVKGTPPAPRHGHSASVISGSMFVYGGRKDSGVIIGDLWQFNLRSRVWTEISVGGISALSNACMVWLPKSFSMLDKYPENLHIKRHKDAKTYWRSISKEPLVASHREENLGFDNFGVDCNAENKPDPTKLERLSFSRWNIPIPPSKPEKAQAAWGDGRTSYLKREPWDEVEMISFGDCVPAAVEPEKKRSSVNSVLGQLLIVGGEENLMVHYPKKPLAIKAFDVMEDLV